MASFDFEVLSEDQIEMVSGGETPCSGGTQTFESKCMSDGTDESDGPIVCNPKTGRGISE